VYFDQLLSMVLQNTLTQIDVPSEVTRASVSLIFKETGELCMIRRPKKAEDPWSGHMAFPGGREEIEDQNLKCTAERETWEEVRINLSQYRWVGRLNDLVHPRLTVSAFVYLVRNDVLATGNQEEVERIYWIPIEAFSNPDNQSTKSVFFAGQHRPFPVIMVGDADVWGISLEFIQDLLSRLENL